MSVLASDPASLDTRAFRRVNFRLRRSLNTGMKWYTCTPVAFGGGPDFFARDSGLLSRGFQALGIESRAIMPGERKPEDLEELIRTDYGNLESTAWWQSLELDGVVLYAWGRPRFRKVAEAIHRAGIDLVLSQDSSGLVSPLAGFCDWRGEQRALTGGGVRQLGQILKGLSYGLLVTDPLRACHLAAGDVIAGVSPIAVDRYRKLCRFYGRGMAEKVHLLPHAVENHFCFSGVQKFRQIVCVGRWDDEVQKRASLLLQVVEQVTEADREVRFVIAGNATSEMRQRSKSLPQQVRERIDFRGKVSRRELAELLDQSQIFYSPSAYESFGIAAAEALCCGCSVVAVRSVSMASFEWFVEGGDGRLADNDVPNGHARALGDELSAWASVARDPRVISERWSDRLHAPRVAERVMALFGGSLSGNTD